MPISLIGRLLSMFDDSGRRKLALVLPGVAILLAASWLVPRFSFKDEGSLDDVHRSQVSQFIKDVNDSVNREKSASSEAAETKNAANKPRFSIVCDYCQEYQQTNVPLTPLVTLLVKVPVIITGGRPYEVEASQYYPMVRTDNLILMFLILIGVILGLRAVGLSPAAGSASDPRMRPRAPGEPISAESILEADVLKAEERARDVYRRSTILLGGGIVMAFVGVALFYVTLPSPSTTGTDAFIGRDRLDIEYFYLREARRPPGLTGDEHPWLTFASHSLRPTGMLIFMEGIAWFLLRQYRVLIEEYKSFLRIYLKRSSYLIAWKAASSATERQFAVAQAMIADDVNPALKNDETTEVLEAMKLSDREQSPIVEVLREVKALLPGLTKR